MLVILALGRQRQVDPRGFLAGHLAHEESSRPVRELVSIEKVGLARWLGGYRHLLPTPTTQIRVLDPTWWEGSDSCKLNSDLHTCTVA